MTLDVSAPIRVLDDFPTPRAIEVDGVGAVTAEEVETFARCMTVGGVALFPTDTVYGLATEPESDEGVRRLYGLKGRVPDKPAAVMFFDLELALAAVPELGPRTAEALRRLLPAAVTAVVPNPARRYPLACGPAPEKLGLRVPRLEGALAPLAAVRWPVLQSSANRSGSPDVRRLADVEPGVAGGVDLALDGGELPGTASTVLDLTDYEQDGAHRILRAGAVPADAIASALS